MVNKKRQALLQTFQTASSWISGEELSQRFGISRVAIWKHIKALQEEGYPLESGHKGYRLTGETDNLSSMDFTPAEEILFFRDLESTMKEAARRRELLKEEDFIILAEQQSGGISRNEQVWDSPGGGIYMTCMINHPLSLKEGEDIPLYGIFSVLKTLKECGISSLGYRLPGDILIRDRKIGGILEEYHVRGGIIRWYALGIGVHINDSFKGKEPTEIESVLDATGIELRRKDFMHSFSKNWKKSLQRTSSEIITDLKKHRQKM